MKLYPISVSQLNYLDSGQFIVRYLTDFANQGLNQTTDPDFKPLHDSLVAQSPVFNEALMQIRAKNETEELALLDIIRDRKVITLRRALSVYEYTDDANELAAYKLIKIVLNTYKDIEKSNYEAESLGIDNLIAELGNAAHAPAVATLGLASVIQNLKTANQKFKEKFDTRSMETISDVVYDTKKLRKDILNTYKDLAEYILVMANRRNTDYYIQILNVINNGREYFANILARQQGGGGTPPTN